MRGLEAPENRVGRSKQTKLMNGDDVSDLQAPMAARAAIALLTITCGRDPRRFAGRTFRNGSEETSRTHRAHVRPVSRHV